MKSTHTVIAAAAFAVLALPATAQERMSRAEQRALQMSVDQVLQQVEIKGQSDDLEPAIWVTTEPFLKRSSSDDKFLRANIDKVTGAIFYQLYLKSVTSDRLDFDRMTFMTQTGLQSAPVKRIWFDVSCYRAACSYYQDFVADLSREQLESLAAEDGKDFWRARLFGGYVEGIDIMLLKNETRAFLSAVDRVSSSHSPPQESE